jgi:hypothetical protein
LVDRRHSLFGHSCEDLDFSVIFAFVNETNHLPLGDVRGLWPSAVLKAKDQEIAQREDAASAKVLAACEALLAKFDGGGV